MVMVRRTTRSGQPLVAASSWVTITSHLPGSYMKTEGEGVGVDDVVLAHGHLLETGSCT
jgi:hypothetical protein